MRKTLRSIQNDRKARGISVCGETILSKVGPGRLRLREKVKTVSQPEYTIKFLLRDTTFGEFVIIGRYLHNQTTQPRFHQSAIEQPDREDS